MFRRIGHRGVALATFAILWAWVGVGTIASNPGERVTGAFHLDMPPVLRLGVWLIGSAGAALAVILGRRRPTLEGVAFLLLMLGPAVRFASYTFVAVLSPLGGTEWWRAAYAAVLMLVMVAFILIVAAWPEPARPEDLEGDDLT